MRVKLKRAKKMRATLDMTPFLDVVFLLIIFFMITATFSPTASIDVELPNASTASVVQKVEDIYVIVDKNDELTYKSEKISFDKLSKVFETEGKNSSKKEVVIAADKLSSHGTVVRIMEISKKNGLKKFSIAVKKSGEGHASL
jgi:biopolymer transport protein ExbD